MQKCDAEMPLMGGAAYRQLFLNAAEGAFFMAPDGNRYLEVNPALARILGFASANACSYALSDLKRQLYVDPADHDLLLRQLQQGNEVVGLESRVHREDGEIIWIAENIKTVFDADGRLSCYTGTVQDVTQRRDQTASFDKHRAYFAQLFGNSPQAIAIIDIRRNLTHCNRSFEAMFGYREVDIIGFGMQPIMVPEELIGESEEIRSALLNGQTVQRETTRRHYSGRLIPVLLTAFPLWVGEVISATMYMYQNISERKLFEAQIAHQTFHDALTGLPNRSLFGERLERALERSRRRPELHYAVLMIDLNKFKMVNERFGHAAGDKHLLEVSKRLSACVRAVDTVARLGSDEFAVILEDFPSSSELSKIAHRIEAACWQSLLVLDNMIIPGAAIGIVSKIAEYTTAEDVLRDADIAMNKAKQEGKSLVIFDKRMHQELIESINLEVELREVLAQDQCPGLILHYQPIVHLESGLIEGFEALIRWDHPLRGLVPPDRFITLAEDTGLIIDLGQWVIDEACRTLRHWQTTVADTRNLTMSVNVSCGQFSEPGLVEYVTDVLQQYQVRPECLKIEVTESVLMQNVSWTVNELQRLRNLGVKLAIDDFGTGYSSLAYLRRMPIDQLKIDRSFISGHDHASQNTQIVHSIISLARNLGLSVVAEGVENRDQLDRLRTLHCDRAQGFFFSRPVQSDLALEMIRNNQPLNSAC